MCLIVNTQSNIDQDTNLGRSDWKMIYLIHHFQQRWKDKEKFKWLCKAQNHQKYPLKLKFPMV
jgi:hypothetical protein